MKWNFDVPLFFKLLLMTFLATISRILYSEESIGLFGVIARIIIGTFLTWASFILAHKQFGLSEDVSVAISGLATFTYRETVDFILKFNLSDFIKSDRNKE